MYHKADVEERFKRIHDMMTGPAAQPMTKNDAAALGTALELACMGLTALCSIATSLERLADMHAPSALDNPQDGL